MQTERDDVAPTLPASLVEAVRSQRAILFLGTGASAEARSPDGALAPKSRELRDQLASRFFGKSNLQQYDLMMLAEMTISANGQSIVFEALRSILLPFQLSPGHMMIPNFRWRAIATSNYDLLIEKAYASSNDRIQNLVKFVKDSEPIEERLQHANNPLIFLKLHGCLDHIHDESIPPILTHEHYARYSKNRTRLFNRLQDLGQEYPIIFCGYSLGDPHIRNLIYNLTPQDHRRPA